MVLVALLTVISVLILGILLFGLNIVNRFRFRNIPGPRPKFFIGNLNEVRAGKAYKAITEWAHKYGPLYVWWQGRFPTVVVSDPDLMKEIGIKHFVKAYYDRPQPPVFYGAPGERRFMNSGLLFVGGKRSKNIRAVCEPLFHSKALASYMPSMLGSMDEILNRIDAVCVDQGKSLEIMNALAGMALDIIGTAAFGVQFESQKLDVAAASGKAKEAPRLLTAARFMFAPAKQRGLTSLLTFIAPSLLPILRKLGLENKESLQRLKDQADERAYLWGASQALLQNSRGGPDALQVPPELPEDRKKVFQMAGNDYADVTPMPHSLLNRLRNAADRLADFPVKDSEICAQALAIVLAGYETTSTALTYAVYELAQHPEIQDRMAAEVRAALIAKQRDGTGALEMEDMEELKYCEAVFNEAMRKYPPVTPMLALSRNASEDCQVGKFFVPKGCKVMLDVWTMHRDERYFPNPMEFKPERFMAGNPEAQNRHPYAYIPFGLGARKCLGYRLAIMEGVLALARMVEHFEFSLDPAMHTGPLEFKSFITMVPVNGVWIKARRRLP